MIKGILALFRSGLILNPMVLLGIILGFWAMSSLEGDMLRAFYTSPYVYLLMLLVASLYVYFFKRTYNPRTYTTNWPATVQTMIGAFLTFVFSFVMSMLFVMVVSFGGEEEENYDLPELQTETEKQAREIQENYKKIMEQY